MEEVWHRFKGEILDGGCRSVCVKEEMMHLKAKAALRRSGNTNVDVMKCSGD